MDRKGTKVSNWLAAVWWIPICDPDDSMYSLNGMHGKLSKKYLDNFPEDRSAGDVGHPAAGVGGFPSEKRLGGHLYSTFPISKGQHTIQAEGTISKVGVENTE